MVKLNYLDLFELYRTSPPVIMPENASNRKKGVAYSVWAPTIQAGLSFLRTTTNYQFRNLYKYFIPKRWRVTLYGQGNKVIKFNEENEITVMLNEAKKGSNLSKIDGVTSYLPAMTSRPMRELNVLCEYNFVFETLLNNPKDRRPASGKFGDVLNRLLEINHLYTKDDPENLIGDYGDRYILIPLNLWFTDEELINPERAMKPTSKNCMGYILKQLSNVQNLRHFPEIDLVYGRMVLRLDGNKLPEGMTSEEILKLIVEFMRRTRTINDNKQVSDADTVILQADPKLDITKIEKPDKKTVKSIDKALNKTDTPDDGVEISKADVSLAKAVKKTREDAAVDEVIKSVKADPDEVPQETKEEIKKSLKTHPTPTPAKVRSDLNVEPAVFTNTVTKDTELSPDEVDLLMKAKIEGRSVASQKRNELLKSKYKEVKLGSVPLEKVIQQEEKYEIPEVQVKAHTINDSLKRLKTPQFEKSYNDQLAQYHLGRILNHFSQVDPPLYLIKDIKIEDASTPMERVWNVSVEYEDTDRKRHRFHFLLPKFYKEKYLYLNDQEMNMSHQKFPYPVTKVSPDKCQLVTNYNKIFTERYGSNLSPRATKIKKIFGGAECPKTIYVERGDSTIPNKIELTTAEFDDIGSVMVKMQIMLSDGILSIYFIVKDAGSVIPVGMAPKQVVDKTYDDQGVEIEEKHEDHTLIPLAKFQPKERSKNPVYYYLSGTSNNVYDQVGNCQGELGEFIIENAIKAAPSVEDQFKETSAGTKFVYARSKIMAEWIPTILAISAADPGGLIAVLEKGKIKYQFMEKRPSVNKDVTGVIPFADGYLIYDRYPYENSLLLNGLLVIPTKEYNFYDMNNRDNYVEIFDSLYGRRTLIDAMHNFYYLMIDPITVDVLERLNMPTDFTRVMLYCVGTLVDNTFQIDSSYMNSRIRSNEIIMAYLYKELATAWEKWSSGREEKFSIWERAIINDIMTAQIVDPHSVLNVTLEAETDNLVKLKGPTGMNEDHSFTLEKRAYHPTMTGIVAMNSTPSGEVGIGRHLTLNANIEDALGFVKVNKEEYDGTELASVGELLQTFGPESADIERVAMAMNQSKHLVPVASRSPGLVSYDMERVIPYISNDFAFRAKKPGKVVEIKDSIIIVQYNDGTYDDIDLAARPDKNVDGGFYVMNGMVAKCHAGQTFKENDILAIDPKYISDKDMFGDPCAEVGCLARVVLEANGDVFEDSGYCTNAFARRMTTKITRQKRVILSRFANIKYMAKVGQEVHANEPILTFDDTEDEFSSQLLQSIAEEEEDDEAIIATGAPVISKTNGRIVDVYIYYTIPLDQMTPSMRKIVEDYDKKAKQRQKTLSKYIKPSDANTRIKPAEMIEPDGQGKVKGVPVGDGVIIDFYIEYEDILSVGDKSSSFSALKTTFNSVIPDGYEPYTDFNPERKIDMALATAGMYKRMCLDIVKVGGITKFLIEMKRLHKNKYAERIKAELKKK